MLSANGRAFTAGLDITEPSILNSQSSSQHGTQEEGKDQEGEAAEEGDGEMDVGRVADTMRRHVLDFQDAISSLQRCAKPVICCMHGLVLGLGIDIASAADIRYASTDASFCIKEVDIGLAADIGSLQRVPGIVGSQSWVKELALTARRFDSAEALQHGFLSRVVQGHEECVKEGIKTAMVMAEKSPVAVQGTKMLLDYSRDHTIAEGLLMTAVWNAAMLQSKDVNEAIQATLSKRKGRFAVL